MMSSTGRRSGAAKRRNAPFRTAQSRKLVEDYWRSVIHSTGEPPLYHTFSDRYGGTQGIPFAARTDCSAVVEHQNAGRADDTAEGYLKASEEAMRRGDLSAVRSCLKHALTYLQNSAGGLGLAELTATKTLHTGHTTVTAEVLRRLAKLSILCGQHEDALRLLDLSSEADPLTSDTYVLRASCYERMREYARAFHELEKYMKLNEPSLDVLAHCGKCAAEAGDAAGARRYLGRLLELAEGAAGVEPGGAAVGDGVAEEVLSCAYHTAHAHFYLGFVSSKEACQASASGLDAASLRSSARRHFEIAAANEAYVLSYERNVDLAIAAEDHALALELLGYLEQMAPDCAEYHLRSAHVCHLTGDIHGELRGLSEALDRHQTRAARRTTLLARGTVYSEKAGDLLRAIKDFTIVISLPEDDPHDHCTPVAYLKRAEAYRRRHAQARAAPLQRKEDQAAMLRDYQNFLNATQKADTACGQLGEEGSSSSFICHPQCLTEAMLILSNGAFRRGNYTESARFFADAIARGWIPQAPHVGNPPPDDPELVSLYDKMYVALACHVIEEYPVNDDMFKVPYEPREWVAPQDSKKARAAERKDADRPTFASPSLSFLMVDAHYNALRALEPTMFSALEWRFLEIWEPYRSEVERTRDDVMLSRGGKRAKRHGGQ